MVDIKELQAQFNKAIAQKYGMDLDFNDTGYSLEQLYDIAGKEDRVITVSFREGSPSYSIWGDSVTCCLIYTERERRQLMKNIKNGVANYGKVRAKYLLFDYKKNQIEKLKNEGFDSQDVVEILIAPFIQVENVYNGDKPRKLNQMMIEIEPEPPFEEIKFEFGVLCKFLEHGMLLTPSENVDFLALKLLLGVKLPDAEKVIVFDEEGRIHNNAVSRRYLYYKSRLHELSDDKKKVQAQLELMRSMERLNFLDDRLKEMGSSLEKLNAENSGLCEQMVKKAQKFNEVRLNHSGRYPVFLTYKGYIHIALRHIQEWQFGDYYNGRDKFQLREEDIIPTLSRIVDDLNEEYQIKKAERPDYQYRKFGKNSIYLNGDYYMIHIASDGSIENFSKTVYKGD